MSISSVGISAHPYKTFTPHSHPDWEIVLNLEGEGITKIGKSEYRFTPGTIICQPPHLEHVKVSSGGVFRDIYFQTTDFINPTGDAIPIFNDDEAKSIETMLFMMLRIYQKKESNYKAIVTSLNETINQLLLSWADRQPHNKTVELFKNELIENFTNPEFKLGDIVNDTLYCCDYFRRCFKKETGTTPMAYLIQLRIEHAKKLLKQQVNTSMSISEIAFLSGFYDAHYFSRLFKEKVGETPQEYSNQNKIKTDP